MRRQDALHHQISDTNFSPDTFEGDGGRVPTVATADAARA
jgi:hypothetical protein